MLCITYACDDNYALQTAVSIESLYENNESVEGLDTYVFDDGITEGNKARLDYIAKKYHRKIFFIDSMKIIEEIRKIGCISNVDNSSLSTYVRIFFRDYIDESKYDRMLYIDADTIITGSIGELESIEMNKTIAAVIDLMPQEYKEIIGLGDSCYYNCGVLLFNLKSWKEGAYQEKLANHLNNIYHDYLYADQDLINIVLKGQIMTLPLKYNYFPFYGELDEKYVKLIMGDRNRYYDINERMNLTKENISIIHLVYSVLDRPWFEKNLNPYNELWDEYVKKTGWEKPIKKKRKPYSRTRILQMLYKMGLINTVIAYQTARNHKAIKSAAKRYRQIGVAYRRI